MLKNILNLKGIQILNKRQQSLITGMVDKCCIRIPNHPLPETTCCRHHQEDE